MYNRMKGFTAPKQVKNLKITNAGYNSNNTKNKSVNLKILKISVYILMS